MKNTFQKCLSAFLAVILILTAAPLSIISFAWDPNVDDGFNLSLKTKIFHEVDGEWVEAETVEPGESVKARVYIGTDYYAGPGQVVVFYSNNFFEDEYASNASIELAVNADPESSTKKYKIDGFFNKGKGIIYALLDGGYITEEFAQTHTALTFFYMFEGSSPTCQILSDEHWFAEFDLKVREDATGDGDFVILEDTVTDPYEHQDAYISITKGQEGSHPDNASNMYLWSADVTIESSAVSVPVTYSDYTVETYIMNTDGGYDMTSETIEAEAGSVVDASYTVEEGFELNSEKSILSGTVAADGSLVLKVYIDRISYTLTVDNGESKTTSDYLYGEPLDEPDISPKFGFSFIKWEPQLPETMPAENLTVTAVWEANLYNAVFESENEEFDWFEVAFNSEIPFPENTPQKEGFNFLGWSLDGVNVLETLGIMDAEGKKFYAVWEAKEPEHVHIPQVITVPATCTEDGSEYTICSACKEPLSEITVLPSGGHSPADEWKTVTEPTLTQNGKKIKECTVCGETAEESDISMLRVAESDGVQIEYSPDDYSGEVGISADKPSDKNTQDLINNEIGTGNGTVYDLAITVNGSEAQPESKVTVKLPLPEGYDAGRSSVYEINTADGTVKEIDAEYKDGYFIFETTVLGSYVIFEAYDGVLKIRKPSITTIKYGDAIILHADLSKPLPKGAYIKWTADNGNFSYTASKDGSTCQITPSKTGNTTFTATVYDSSGNEIQSDTQTMTSKAGFFQKIGAFFRKLFKLTKVYPELFRHIV